MSRARRPAATLPARPRVPRGGRRRAGLALRLAVTLPLLTPGPGWGQAAAPPRERPLSATVRWTSGGIRLDGILDEPAWAAADPVTAFFQREPDEGAPASERTLVRFVATPRGLHVGLMAEDRTPGAVRAAQLRRDADLDSDDSFSLLLDPQGDRRSGYLFSVNPNGALYDAEIVAVGVVDRGWDGVWDARARRTATGWTAEIVIPWSTLRYPPGGARWGLNLSRFIRHRNEEALWGGWRRAEGLLFQDAQGTLEGLAGLPARTPELRPYVSARRSHGEEPATDLERRLDDGGRLDAGGEAELAVTPNLGLDLTVNTDFAQVEVDEQVVNLTRFPIFFPEKRPFFLEGSGIFDFGELEETQLFYSRRIGLARDGSTVPLTAGARLHGRAGAYRLGAVAARTGGGERALDLVGRVQRDVLSRGYVGAMLTSQSLPGAAARWAAGADARIPVVVRGQNLVFSAYHAAAGGGTPGASGAWGLLVEGPNDWADYYAGVSRVGRGFDPPLGFVETDGVLRHLGGFGVFPRPAIAGVRRLNVKPLSWEVLRDLEGGLVSASYEVRPLGVLFESDDLLELNLQRFDDVFVSPFEVFPGTIVPPGRYSDRRAEILFASSAARSFSLDLSLSRGGFYGGSSTDVEAAAELRLAPHVVTGVEYAVESVSHPAGRFNAASARVRVDAAASPRLGGSLFAQWENQSRDLTLNARLHWAPRPDTDVYLVWNAGWATDAADGIRPRQPLAGGWIAKVVHAFSP